VREKGGSSWQLQIEDDGRYLNYTSEWQIGLRMPRKRALTSIWWFPAQRGHTPGFGILRLPTRLTRRAAWG